MPIRAQHLGWLGCYLVFAGLVVGSLWYARAWALAELDRPAARAEWQRWQQEESQRAAESASPVARRIPKSAEPPVLVILRDSFAGVVVSCLVIGSFLFGFLVIVVRGVWRGQSAESHGMPRGGRRQ